MIIDWVLIVTFCDFLLWFFVLTLGVVMFVCFLFFLFRLYR